MVKNYASRDWNAYYESDGDTVSRVVMTQIAKTRDFFHP